MVTVSFSLKFERDFKKIKNQDFKDKLKKQIKKITENPEIGKPMRYSRKDSREVYVSPYRLSYAWFKEEDKIVLLSLYHKDLQ